MMCCGSWPSARGYEMATQTKIPPLTLFNPWWGHDPSDKGSPAIEFAVGQFEGSPAHAGIDRPLAAAHSAASRFPRPRGDRPSF